MMRLRPYKSCDADLIAEWIKDKKIFQNWGGERFGNYPVTSNVIDEKYSRNNGDCVEPDNFYPWTVIDDDNRVVGHFIMRYIGGDNRKLRFGWVIVDDTLRGKGYGKEMLLLGLKYAFDIFKVERVTIGVFENNKSAYWCYRKVGFIETEIVQGEPWNIVEMEITKSRYYEN